MTPMTQDEIRLYFEHEQSTLSRDLYQDLAIYQEQIKARVLKFEHDCAHLARREHEAMQAAPDYCQYKMPKESRTVAA